MQPPPLQVSNRQFEVASQVSWQPPPLQLFSSQLEPELQTIWQPPAQLDNVQVEPTEQFMPQPPREQLPSHCEAYWQVVEQLLPQSTVQRALLLQLSAHCPLQDRSHVEVVQVPEQGW